MLSLHNLFTKVGLYEDQIGDNTLNNFKGRIAIDTTASYTEKIAALNLCSRIGLESTAIDLPILHIDDNKLPYDIRLEIIQDNDPNLLGQIQAIGDIVYIQAYSTDGLSRIVEYMCSMYPSLGTQSLSDILEEISSDQIITTELLVNRIRFIENKVISLDLELCPINDSEASFISKGYILDNVSKNIPMEYTANALDVTNLFSFDGLYMDRDNDFQSDYINCKIVCSKDIGNQEMIATSLLSTKLGIECLGLNYPLAIDASMTTLFPNHIMLYVIEDSSMEDFTVRIDGNKVIFKGSESNLLKGMFGYLTDINNLTSSQIAKQAINTVKEVNSTFNKLNTQGQLAHLSMMLDHYITPKEEVQCFVEPSIDTSLYANFKDYLDAKHHLDNLSVQSYRDTECVYERSYDIAWEVDSFKRELEEKLYPTLKPDDRIKILGMLSEDIDIRRALLTDIMNKAKEIGAVLEEDSKIYCSYKQGYSWITESIIPRLNDKKVSRIEIEFKSFLPPGQDKWTDEDGAIPNLNASRDSDPDKWFDLPIRFLQELYPIDDTLASELDMDRDNIIFINNDAISSTYRVTAYSIDDIPIIRDSYDVRCSEIPYLHDYPDIGKVHPNTGGLTVYVNDVLTLNTDLKTDLENFWDIYQREILSDVKNYIIQSTNGLPNKSHQPFFNTLRLDIAMSEPDYTLRSRKDMISTLDALHEDIYFVGLDYLKTLGIRNFEEAFDEPGLILPVINKRDGQKPSVKVSLLKDLHKQPRYTIDNTTYNIEFDQIINTMPTSISYRDGTIKGVVIKAFANNQYDIKLLRTIAELHNNGVLSLDLAVDLEIHSYLLGNHRDTLYLYAKKKPEVRKHVLSISDVSIPTQDVIGYDKYIALIDELKGVPDLDIWKASSSYQGRDIYCIDIYEQYNKHLVSRTKLINYKPTYLINNRHHANEVSSTNAAFKTINELLLRDENRELLKKINLSIIPFENVDGGAIHYDLQKDNPEWKLHIARFNSVGKEFAREYFKSDTKYTESLALPRAWSKWLPDIVVDNHGVPSHEWDQQFSGYTAPWFKGFWLPRALFYGYFWYVDSPDYPHHKGLNESLQDYVANGINSDEEIVRWNRDWKDRFEKYAHHWMPKLFPANYYKDLIFYWLAYKPNKDAWHVSHRFPWITAIDWTTEVSDETAQGPYLELCSKAHTISNLSTIKMLAQSKKDIITSHESFDSEKVLTKIRKRPLSY